MKNDYLPAWNRVTENGMPKGSGSTLIDALDKVLTELRDAEQAKTGFTPNKRPTPNKTQLDAEQVKAGTSDSGAGEESTQAQEKTKAHTHRNTRTHDEFKEMPLETWLISHTLHVAGQPILMQTSESVEGGILFKRGAQQSPAEAERPLTRQKSQEPASNSQRTLSFSSMSTEQDGAPGFGSSTWADGAFVTGSADDGIILRQEILQLGEREGVVDEDALLLVAREHGEGPGAPEGRAGCAVLRDAVGRVAARAIEYVLGCPNVASTGDLEGSHHHVCVCLCVCVEHSSYTCVYVSAGV
jgi:hypothetical protein